MIGMSILENPWGKVECCSIIIAKDAMQKGTPSLPTKELPHLP